MHASGPVSFRGLRVASRLVALERGRMFVGDYQRKAGADMFPPLLLLHGAAVSGFTWHKVVPRLARWQVLVPDLFGAGSSDRPPPRHEHDYDWWAAADSVAELLWRLEIPQVDVVGHGFGALVAVALHTRVSRRVRKLVLVSAPCPGWSPPWPVRFVQTRLGAQAFASLVGLGALQRFVHQGRAAPELIDARELAVYGDHLTRAGGREALAATLRQLQRTADIASLYDQLRAPVSLLWGDRDRIIPPEHGERLADRLGTRIDIIDGCGHAPQEERPLAFVAALEKQLTDAISPSSSDAGPSTPIAS